MSTQDRVRNVLVFGATPMAVEIARLALKNGDRIFLVASSEEKREAVCQSLADTVFPVQNFAATVFDPLFAEYETLQQEVSLFVPGSRITGVVFAWDLFPGKCNEKCTKEIDPDELWFQQSWQIASCVQALHARLIKGCPVFYPRHWMDVCKNDLHLAACEAVQLQAEDLKRLTGPDLTLNFFGYDFVQEPRISVVNKVWQSLSESNAALSPVKVTAAFGVLMEQMYGMAPRNEVWIGEEVLEEQTA